MIGYSDEKKTLNLTTGDITMATEETLIKEEIKEWLDVNGWFHFHILQRRYAYKGISDIIAIRKGQVAFIEVKSKTGKLSEFRPVGLAT